MTEQIIAFVLLSENTFHKDDSLHSTIYFLIYQVTLSMGDLNSKAFPELSYALSDA